MEDTDDIDVPGFLNKIYNGVYFFPAPGNLLNKIFQAVQTFETPGQESPFPLTPDFNAESPNAQELPPPRLLESDLRPPSAQKRLFPESVSDRRDQPLASPLQYKNDPWLGFKFDYKEIANCFVYN